MIKLKIEASNVRLLFFLGCSFCLIILGLAYVLEYVFNLSPCPLCLFQRYVFWAIAFLFLMITLHNPKSWGRFLYLLLLIFLSLLGASLALWQTWLQHLPPSQTPACISNLEKLFEYYPLQEVIHQVLLAPGDCSKIDFTIFGFSLAEGSLVIFLLLALFCGFLIYKSRK